MLGALSIASSLVDRRGYFAAPVRAGLVVADPGDDGRARARSRGSSESTPGHRTCSWRTTRASTTSRSSSRRCRTSCGSSPRHRSAGFRSSAGTCAAPGTCSSTGAGPTRARHPRAGARLTARGAVAHRLSRGHAQPRRPRRGASRAAASCSRLDAGLPVVPLAVVGSRHVMRKGRLAGAGEVTLIVTTRSPRPARSRDRPRPATPRPWPIASARLCRRRSKQRTPGCRRPRPQPPRSRRQTGDAGGETTTLEAAVTDGRAGMIASRPTCSRSSPSAP